MRLWGVHMINKWKKYLISHNALYSIRYSCACTKSDIFILVIRSPFLLFVPCPAVCGSWHILLRKLSASPPCVQWCHSIHWDKLSWEHIYIEIVKCYELIKAMIFSVATYGCESWTIKKAECWRTDAFKLWCWRRLLRVHWTARRSNHSALKEINPEYSLEGLMLMLKLQHFNKETTHWERPWCWEILKGKVEGGGRGWDG